MCIVIFNGQQPTYQAAQKDIEPSKADVVLVIKEGYGKSAELLIASNAVNGTKGSMGSIEL